MNQRLFLAALLALGTTIVAPSCNQVVSVLEGTGGACDGTKDGGAGITSCGHGQCHVLMDLCVDGQVQQCTPGAPSAEVCDGIDNDCNGAVDEGCACAAGQTQPCFNGSLTTRAVGLCHDGAQACAGGVWTECTGDVLPAPEVCDQRDNDCNGIIDEGCPCAPGQEQPCYGGSEPSLQHLPCKAGVQTCKNDGTWGDCEGQVLPTFEIPDGIDNDCNGTVDDG